MDGLEVSVDLRLQRHVVFEEAVADDLHRHDSGSFSAVAREAGIGQPAVSKQIAALELGSALSFSGARRGA